MLESTINGDPRYPCSLRSRRAGFTLVEILVTISIIGVLVALVLPMASKTIGSAKAFKCQQSQRSSAYDFTVFADDVYHGNRGPDNQRKTSFRLETFVASQYCLQDFWCWEGDTTHSVLDTDSTDPLRCPQVRGDLLLRNNSPCEAGGVEPWQNVSFAFNMRLKYVERVGPPPGPPVYTVWITSSILSESDVPLLWDTDAEASSAQGRSPFYSAPSLGTTGLFGGNRYWFPAMRHNATLNVAFVDGHVESTRAPLAESQWRWDFSPRR